MSARGTQFHPCYTSFWAAPSFFNIMGSGGENIEQEEHYRERLTLNPVYHTGRHESQKTGANSCMGTGERE